MPTRRGVFSLDRLVGLASLAFLLCVAAIRVSDAQATDNLGVSLEATFSESGDPLPVGDALGAGSDGNDTFRSLVQFDTSEIESLTITSATLVLQEVACNTSRGELTVFLVTEAWDDEVVWGTQPDIDTEMSSTDGNPWICPGNAPVEIDVTEIVQAWAGDPEDNFGIALRGDEENVFLDTDRYFKSSITADPPYIGRGKLGAQSAPAAPAPSSAPSSSSSSS